MPSIFTERSSDRLPWAHFEKKMEMAHSSVQSAWRVERAPSCSSPTFESRLRLFQRKILAEPMQVLLAASVENRLWYGLFQQF